MNDDEERRRRRKRESQKKFRRSQTLKRSLSVDRYLNLWEEVEVEEEEEEEEVDLGYEQLAYGGDSPDEGAFDDVEMGSVDREILREEGEEGVMGEEPVAPPALDLLANVDAEEEESGEEDGDPGAANVQLALPPALEGLNLLANIEEEAVEEESGEEDGELGDVQLAVLQGGPDGDVLVDPWAHQEENLRDGDNAAFKLLLGTFLAKMTAAGRCTKTAAKDMLDFFARHAEQIVRMKSRGFSIRSVSWLLETTYAKIAPVVTTEFFILNSETRLQTCVARGSVFTKDVQDMNTVKRSSHVALIDMLQHIYNLHGVNFEDPPERWRVIDFASDGVTFTNYGSWKYHIASVSLPACGKPYPYYVHQIDPTSGGKVSVQDLLSPFVQELQDLPFNMELRWIIGDSKERKFVKGLSATNSKFGCEFCMIQGGRVEGDHKTRTSFPPPRIQPQARSTADCRRSMERQQRQFLGEGCRENFRWRKHRGVATYSPLLDIEDFDVIYRGPIDSMHLLALGLAKKIFWLTVGASQVMLGAFNAMVVKVRMPSEMGRRTRTLTTKYKASEWRLVGKFCIPWMAKSGILALLPVDELQILLLFCYLYRALDLPDEDFAILQESMDLSALMGRMQQLYTEAFGEGEHTFNDHNFFQHLLQIRRECGPLCNYSCWKFEHLFSQLKSNFAAGTTHEGKQILQRFYAKDKLQHSCQGQQKVIYSHQRSKKKDDSAICTREGFFRVVRNPDNERYLVCTKIETERLETAEEGLAELDWDLVGARRYLGEGEEITRVERREITGKAVLVGETILECKLQSLLLE